jgi:hypothetical protein
VKLSDVADRVRGSIGGRSRAFSARLDGVRKLNAYVESYPTYVIYPNRIAQRGCVVTVLGHTTGSHLGLPDQEESQLTLIWLAELVTGAIRSWRLIEDTPENRQRFGLEAET